MADLIADPFRAARLVLHLRQEGVTDDGVVRAMETIDRGAFVEDAKLAELAFEDCVLPLPCGQYIPRPGATGQLLQALQIKKVRELRLLLVGTGSGYSSALAAQLFADVFTVERFRSLADAARTRLGRLGVSNVAVRHEDGLYGWPERGPYDRILLMGSVREIPEVLLGQLARGGLLVAPLETAGGQVICRTGGSMAETRLPLSHPLGPLVEGRALAL